MKIQNFLLYYEKIPEKIRANMLADIKSVIEEYQGDTDTINTIATCLLRSQYSDLLVFGTTLSMFYIYRHEPFLGDWFQLFAERVFEFDFEKSSFKALRKIVSTFELLDIEVPLDMQNAFNTLLNDDSIVKSQIGPGEQGIVDDIVNNSGLYGFSIGMNEYILGFEVDIVVYDIRGDVFAIIESDGVHHSHYHQAKADRRRDQLFYRRGITDIIIRKTRYGCTIVKNTNGV